MYSLPPAGVPWGLPVLMHHEPFEPRVPMGLGPTPRGQRWPLRTGGSPTYGALPPPRGGPMAPPSIGGGGRLVASLLVLVSFTSKFTNILGLVGW